MAHNPDYSFDTQHKTPRRSIYVRTDYIAPLNMAIPLALGGTLQYGFKFEEQQRTGIPRENFRPIHTPIIDYLHTQFAKLPYAHGGELARFTGKK